MARSRDFSRQECNIGNVKDICKRAGYSQVGSETLPLVAVRFGSQTLVVVREWMRF